MVKLKATVKLRLRNTHSKAYFLVYYFVPNETNKKSPNLYKKRLLWAKFSEVLRDKKAQKVVSIGGSGGNPLSPIHILPLQKHISTYTFFCHLEIHVKNADKLVKSLNFFYMARLVTYLH